MVAHVPPPLPPPPAPQGTPLEITRSDMMERQPSESDEIVRLLLITRFELDAFVIVLDAAVILPRK